nr:MAG: Putative metallopeptidase [Bacteriophage sp.]
MNNMNIEDFNNKQFDIFGTIFTIKLVDTLDKDDELFHYGIAACNAREIRISKEVLKAKQPDSELYITLVHEIMHVVLDTGQYLEESQKEPLVEWLTRCIISLLKQDILCK